MLPVLLVITVICVLKEGSSPWKLKIPNFQQRLRRAGGTACECAPGGAVPPEIQEYSFFSGACGGQGETASESASGGAVPPEVQEYFSAAPAAGKEGQILRARQG